MCESRCRSLACWNHSWVLEQLGALDEAELAYRDHAARRAENAEAQYLLAYFLSTRGHTDEAIAKYGRVLELEPDHPYARQRLQALLDEPSGAPLAEPPSD